MRRHRTGTQSGSTKRRCGDLRNFFACEEQLNSTTAGTDSANAASVDTHPTLSSGEMDDITLPHSESEGVSSNHDNILTQEDMLSTDNPEANEGRTTVACTLSESVICSGDFGKVARLKSPGNHSFTNDEMFVLLKNCFVPSSSYSFPARDISGRQRPFQHSWLSKYNGLCYSVTDSGGYCKFCVLFAKCSPSVARLGILIEKPFTNFKKATEILGNHFHGTSQGGASKGRHSHQAAVEAAMSFIAFMENRELAIDAQLSSIRRENIAKNRLKLKSIVETIIFCGRQGIPLRGHRDNNPNVQENALTNHGNFLALLHFRAHSGDDVMKNHLENAKGNARYTSHVVQNQLITICGDLIREKLLENFRNARFFSELADEATDTANVEQPSLSIRFVQNNAPCEKFFGFLKCETGTTGEAIP